MAANTFAMMAALSRSSAFSNPHKWIATTSEDNQYGRSIEVIKKSIVHELQQLGVDADVIIDKVHPLPLDEAGEFDDWTTSDSGFNHNGLFRYMTEGDHAGGLLTSGGSTSGALTLDNLYTLANNMVWCWHNLHSFTAWTDFLSGEYQHPDKATTTSAQELDYIPIYHSYMANNFSQFSQILTLATNHDAANTTVNAHSIIYTSINSASIALISNSSPFASNSTIMYIAKAPSINSMAMWFYTANGTAELNPSGSAGDRPGGLVIDRSDPADPATHPAASMTPLEVYTQFINRVNNYTYMVRSFITDSPVAGDYEPLPGVTRANTFIVGAKDWVQERAQALHMVDIMSRTTLPGAVSLAVQNAAEGLPIPSYIWAWNAVGETHGAAGSGAALQIGGDVSSLETVPSGIQFNLPAGTNNEPYIDFYDEYATPENISGTLNGVDTAQGRYLHGIYDFGDAPEFIDDYARPQIGQRQSWMYWYQEVGSYVGVITDPQTNPEYLYSLSDGMRVVVYDMHRRDDESGAIAPWSTVGNQPEAPIILEPYWLKKDNPYNGDVPKPVICGFILADRILTPDEITIPIDITKASS